MRHYSLLDRFITEADKALRTIAPNAAQAHRASPASALIEVQILNLAEKFDLRVNGEGASKATTPQLVEKIAKESPGDYDSMIVDAFVKAFGQKAQAVAQ